ncbi:MAG TPA: hypothetical protein VNI01_13750 [Elusimicrobiota bacterium]|nr:hypothetical protein [Elusimicrobiota bacterium]
MPALLAALLAASLPAAAEIGLHCPQETSPVRTADPARPWACAGEAGSGGECPDGYEVGITLDAQRPYRCVLSGLSLATPLGFCPPGESPVPSTDPAKSYECESARGGMRALPCPRGTAPVATPRGLKPFSCAAAGAARSLAPGPRKPARDGSCPEGTSRRRTEDPFEPVQCVALEREGDAPAPGRARTFVVPGVLLFEYPGRWHLTDAWKDEVPSALLFLDTGQGGRPVSLTVTLRRAGQPGYEPMEQAMEEERRWHGARDAGERKVAGSAARLQEVPGESDEAFVPVAGGYLHVAYGAPPDLYARNRAAFEKVLDTLRLGKGEPSASGAAPRSP